MTDAVSVRLAEETQRILRQHDLTREEAQQRSGVSKSTIQAMAKEGRAPGCEHVIRFAKAFGEDVAEWLELCGYADIAADYRGHAPRPPISELEKPLERVPLGRRKKAREAAKRAIETLIVPLYSEVAA